MCLSVVTTHVMIVEVDGAIGSTLTVNYSPELHEQQFLCLFDTNISWVRTLVDPYTICSMLLDSGGLSANKYITWVETQLYIHEGNDSQRQVV